MDITAAKAELRGRLRAQRRQWRAEHDDAAWQTVAAGLLCQVEPVLSRLSPGSTVASFESLRTEPPMAAVNSAIVQRGHRLLLPVLLDDRDLDWSEHGTAHGPAAIGAADLVLLPALALDCGGGRLGQGGGSYDRALERVNATTTLIGCVHPHEVLAELPCEPHDRLVHAALTCTGLRVLGNSEVPVAESDLLALLRD